MLSFRFLNQQTNAFTIGLRRCQLANIKAKKSAQTNGRLNLLKYGTGDDHSFRSLSIHSLRGGFPFRFLFFAINKPNLFSARLLTIAGAIDGLSDSCVYVFFFFAALLFFVRKLNEFKIGFERKAVKRCIVVCLRM